MFPFQVYRWYLSPHANVANTKLRRGIRNRALRRVAGFSRCRSPAGWLLAIAGNADDEGRVGTLAALRDAVGSASCSALQRQLRQFLTFVFDSPRAGEFVFCAAT